MSVTRSRPASMADVAKIAGVSHQTVSRVVNGSSKVAPATRRRVEEAIRELEYRPNMVAKYLAKRTSDSLGIITFGDTIFGPANTLLAVQEAARDAGFFIAQSSHKYADPNGLLRVLNHFLGLGVNGIVVVAPQEPLSQAVLAANIATPTVMIAAGASAGGNVYVTGVDQLAGARKAVAHLAQAGHTKIAHIRGPAGWHDAREREQGWRLEMAARGLRATQLLAGDWGARSGYEAAQSLLAGEMPDAIFAANDLMAMGAMRALSDAGIRVGQDIAVVGFDDIPGTEVLQPALTTVRQDFHALGAMCIDLLFAAMQGEAYAGNLLEPPLIVRESA